MEASRPHRTCGARGSLQGFGGHPRPPGRGCGATGPARQRRLGFVLIGWRSKSCCGPAAATSRDPVVHDGGARHRAVVLTGRRFSPCSRDHSRQGRPNTFPRASRSVVAVSRLGRWGSNAASLGLTADGAPRLARSSKLAASTAARAAASRRSVSGCRPTWRGGRLRRCRNRRR